jgi:hypothetical protein
MAQRLPEIRRAPLTPEQRAHLVGVEWIRTEARAERAREARANTLQREIDAEKRARADAWAEDWSQQIARAGLAQGAGADGGGE